MSFADFLTLISESPVYELDMLSIPTASKKAEYIIGKLKADFNVDISKDPFYDGRHISASVVVDLMRKHSELFPWKALIAAMNLPSVNTNPIAITGIHFLNENKFALGKGFFKPETTIKLFVVKEHYSRDVNIPGLNALFDALMDTYAKDPVASKTFKDEAYIRDAMGGYAIIQSLPFELN